MPPPSRSLRSKEKHAGGVLLRRRYHGFSLVGRIYSNHEHSPLLVLKRFTGILTKYTSSWKIMQTKFHQMLLKNVSSPSGLAADRVLMLWSAARERGPGRCGSRGRATAVYSGRFTGILSVLPILGGQKVPRGRVNALWVG